MAITFQQACSHLNGAIEQYFAQGGSNLTSMDKTQACDDHSNESYCTVRSCGTVNYALQVDCGSNPSVRKSHRAQVLVLST